MRSLLFLAVAGCLTATGAYAQQSSLSTTLPAKKVADKETDSNRKYTMGMTFSLTGRQFDDEVINARMGRAIIGANMKANLLNWMDARLAVTQIFTSGASSNLYSVTEGGSGLNSLLLDEASLTLKPVDQIKLRGGILEIDQNPILSIIGPASWTAATVIGEQSFGGFTLSASALQGIPTARGTSNQVLDEDTLPLYTNGTLMAEYSQGKTGFSTGVAATHFVFTDPSSMAASDSEQTGSTVAGAGKTAMFLYDYRGMEYGANVKYKFITESHISLAASTIRNELAPAGQNAGNVAKVEYKHAMDRWNVTGNVSLFEVQSDAYPSAYAAPSMGFTNRKGFIVNGKVENKKERITMLAGYTKADVLDNDVNAARFQSDREIYTLGVEVKHDLF